MYKNAWCTCKLLFSWYKRIAFCRSRCQRRCRCLSRLPIVVIQKICYNGNVTLHFSVTSLYFKRYFYKYKTKLLFILPYGKYFKMRKWKFRWRIETADKVHIFNLLFHALRGFFSVKIVSFRRTFFDFFSCSYILYAIKY